MNRNEQSNYTNKGTNVCQFHLKLGVCKYGTNCTKKHVEPTNSKTLLLHNFYIKQEMTFEPFDIIYMDIFQQMHKYGQILDLIIIDNKTDYLSGNVYVKYKRHQDCLKAYLDINNRWYNKKPVYATMTNISNFNDAICTQTSLGNPCNKVNPKTNINECNLFHIKQPSAAVKRDALLANYIQYNDLVPLE